MKRMTPSFTGVFVAAVLVLLAGCVGARREMPAPTVAAGAIEVVPPANALPMTVTGAPHTVHSVMAAALAHHPDLVLLRQELEVVRAEAVTCSGLRNPELRVGYDEGGRRTERTWYTNAAFTGMTAGTNAAWRPLAERAGDSQDSDSLRLTLRVFPPNPWLLQAQGAGARARFAAAAADLRAAEWKVEGEVRRLFNEMDFLTKDLGLAGQLADLRREGAETLRTLADKHQVTAVDELAAVQKHYQALMDREKIESSLAARRAELAALAGEPVWTVTLEPQGEEAPGTALDGGRLAAMREKVVENRQEIVAAYWRDQSARAALREARSLRIPWFTYIQGSYARGGAQESLTTAADLQAVPDPVVSTDEIEDREWGIEAALEIPVFSLGARATRLQRADCRRWATVFGETTRTVLAQLDETVTAWREASRRAERLEPESLELLKRAERLMGQMAERHDLAPGDPAKVQETIVQVKRTLLQSGFEKRQAWLRIQEAFGAPLKAVETPPEIR